MEWKNISEELPDDFKNVLLAVNGGVEVGYYDSGREIFATRLASLQSVAVQNVSHWMYFPEPPKVVA
jgi:hypothetical protein